MKWWRLPHSNEPYASIEQPHPDAVEIPEPGSEPVEVAEEKPEKKGKTAK